MDKKQKLFLTCIIALGIAALIFIFALAARGQELDSGTYQEGEASGAPAGG